VRKKAVVRNDGNHHFATKRTTAVTSCQQRKAGRPVNKCQPFSHQAVTKQLANVSVGAVLKCYGSSSNCARYDHTKSARMGRGNRPTARHLGRTGQGFTASELNRALADGESGAVAANTPKGAGIHLAWWCPSARGSVRYGILG
jgi:hypothetical protein